MKALPPARPKALPSWRLVFSPSVLGLSFVLCACMALMALAHWRWDENLRSVLAARDNLAQSRRFALLAQLKDSEQNIRDRPEPAVGDRQCREPVIDVPLRRRGQHHIRSQRRE